MASGDLTGTVGRQSERPGAYFDGVDDYVEIPHNANQLGTNLSNGFTISAWINPRSLGEGNAGRIFDKGESNNAANGFVFYVAGTARIGFKINVGTGSNSGNNSITFGTWQHVLVTVSSGQLVNHYVNGVLEGTANQNLVQGIATITTTLAPRIGNRANASDFTFDGGIRKVKMWNKVLSAAEIAADFKGAVVAYKNLILDVPLKDDYNDNSRTGLTGTNSGTFLTKSNANALMADINSINLPAVTDQLAIEETEGRDGRFKVTGVAREA